MTHAAVQSHPSQSSTATASHRRSPGTDLLTRLSGERIAASASAITLNAAVLMLMLVPLAATRLLPETISETEAIFLPRDPPPPAPPVPVPVTARPIVPQAPTVPLRRQAVVAPAVAATAEPGDIAVPDDATMIDGDDTNLPPSIATPQTGAQLQYAQAPPPAYPREALREGQRGTVLLRVLVDTDGKPLQVDVAQSSGHRSLDRAARRHVLARWTFRPAVQDGRPVRAIGLVPVEFALR